jgi:hypothetical protein
MFEVCIRKQRVYWRQITIDDDTITIRTHCTFSELLLFAEHQKNYPDSLSRMRARKTSDLYKIFFIIKKESVYLCAIKPKSELQQCKTMLVVPQ